MCWDKYVNSHEERPITTLTAVILVVIEHIISEADIARCITDFAPGNCIKTNTRKTTCKFSVPLHTWQCFYLVVITAYNIKAACWIALIILSHHTENQLSKLLSQPTKTHMKASMETLPTVYLTTPAVSRLLQVIIKLILSPSERAGVFILGRYSQ